MPRRESVAGFRLRWAGEQTRRWRMKLTRRGGSVDFQDWVLPRTDGALEVVERTLERRFDALRDSVQTFSHKFLNDAIRRALNEVIGYAAKESVCVIAAPTKRDPLRFRIELPLGHEFVGPIWTFSLKDAWDQYAFEDPECGARISAALRAAADSLDKEAEEALAQGDNH